MYEHFCTVSEGGDLKGRKMCLVHVFRGTFWSMAGGSIILYPRQGKCYRTCEEGGCPVHGGKDTEDKQGEATLLFSDLPHDLPLPLTSPKISAAFKIMAKPLTPMPVGTLLYLNYSVLPLASSCSFGNAKGF